MFLERLDPVGVGRRCPRLEGQRLLSDPPVDAEPLRNRGQPCIADGCRGARAHRERCARVGMTVHDCDRNRDVEERASVEHVEREARPVEEPTLVRQKILVVRPV